MTHRNYGVPVVKGRMELVEQVARDAGSWVFWDDQRTADMDEPRPPRERLPWLVCIAIWAFVLAPIWFGIIALARWAL